ncbi:LysR family transcriptional regulator [Variovorax sp. MHTC-1]|uniref:LysR family transcriptional regulator n=1 Tax=Variovorax sp. MHTC-1 TaxID=2495593 RepID=UPI000F868741|nr:LysR family transcriptional regulator [Variovorax sp. MHTC-1]RST48219.1 LysR family transcriptional regulator [Variovorax sp. MHTC-1]
MELKQLRCFVMLAEIGNIRRAASMLAMSQPALSVRIQRLEEQLGYALFDREARGVRLTERGTRLLRHAKGLLWSAAETEEAARAIGRGAFDRLEVGLTPIAALSLVPDALRAFSEAHPNVALALTEGVSKDLEEAVAHRRLDFAIVHPPSSRDDLVMHELMTDRYLAVVPVAHPLASARSVSAVDLAPHLLIGVRRDVGPVAFDRIISYFSRAGLSVQISQCATTSISLIGLVAAGAGVGLVVESLRCIARPDIRFVALEDGAPNLAYSLCHRPDLPVALQHAVLAAVKGAVEGREVRPKCS